MGDPDDDGRQGFAAAKVLKYVKRLTVRAQHMTGYVVEVNDTSELHVTGISLSVDISRVKGEITKK